MIESSSNARGNRKYQSAVKADKRGRRKNTCAALSNLLYTMLNAVRKFGSLSSFVPNATEYGAGYRPKLWLNSPLQILFKARNLIGYPLVHANYKLVAHSRFEFRISDCDITGHFPYFGQCPLCFYKHVCLYTVAVVGIWTPNQRAAPDPKGLAGARRFGSIILVSLRICAGGAGKGMCKGNMNTIERINNTMNFAFALAGMEWTKGANNVSRPISSNRGGALESTFWERSCSF